MLTPNGLKVLDHLGVFARIKDVCWSSNVRTFKNDRDETVRKSVVADEKVCGYMNHRLFRRVLLATMKGMLEEAGVPVTYHSKFEGITADSTSGITFRINGREQHCAMLIGADGISSSVRKALEPNIVPEYTGTLGLIAHIHRDTVQWPYPEFEKACTIQGKPGAMFMIPEVKDGSEIMVGMQIKHPDQSRAEWEAMARDTVVMSSFFRKGYEEWHNTAKSIIDSVCASKETMYLWPFLKMPKLESWYSSTGRVVILGDAAHAIPPSSGQGTNQAMEDVYALTYLLANTQPGELLQTLQFWQELRQERIDLVYDWTTNSNNVQRLPEAERLRLLQEGGKTKDGTANDDMLWLYVSDSQQKMDDWLKSRSN